MDISRRDVLGAAACGGLGALLFGVSSVAGEDAEKPAAQPKTGVRIAVVQQESIPGAVGPNREKAVAFCKEALRNHADIVLFHEALVTGYVDNVLELAEEKDGATTRAFQEALRGTDALVLYGLIEREGADHYTAATLVGAGGVLANYRKTHLWWNATGLRHEPTFFRPGAELVTFDLKGWKCGVMICYDGDFPEMTRAYANRDCVMLFWLSNRYSRGKEEAAPLVRANSIIMAASCCCGKNDTEAVYRGGSNITDFNGSVLAEIWETAPGEAGRVQGVQVSCSEDIASHTGPESWRFCREALLQALTGESAGWVLSREIFPISGCRRFSLTRKATPVAPPSRGASGPRAVEDPMHARKHPARNPGDPAVGPALSAWSARSIHKE